MLRPRVLAALAAVGVLLGPGLVAPPAAGSWRWPVRGRVVGTFLHDPRTPFRAGQRRGLDLSAAPGGLVRSACGGPVVFAGPLPGRGLGVTVRCGGLRATLLGLGRVVVRPGMTVRAGAALGEVGPSGVLRLGARRAGARFGYVDPASLLAADPVAAPRLAPPVRPRPRPPRAPAPTPPALAPVARGPEPGPARSLPALARVARGPEPAPTGSPPALAWAGMVLAAAGLPLGGLARGRARRRSASRPVALEAARGPRRRG